MFPQGGFAEEAWNMRISGNTQWEFQAWQMGWEKAVGDAKELAWWSDRAQQAANR